MKLSPFLIICCLLFLLAPYNAQASSKREKQLSVLNARINQYVASKQYAQALRFCNLQLGVAEEPSVSRFLLVSKLRLFAKSNTSIDSIPILFKAQKLFESEPDSIKLFLDARSQEIFGHHFFLKNDFKKAIKNLAIADTLYAKSTAYQYRVYNLNMMGTLYMRMNKYTDALVTLLTADKLLNDKIPYDVDLQTDLHIDIGLIYFKLKKFEKAALHYTSLLDKNINPEQKAQILNNLGIIYIELEDYQTALLYLNSAVKEYSALGLTEEISKAYNNIGSALERLELSPDSVISYYNKAIIIKLKYQDSVGVVAPLLNLSGFYIKNNQYSLAVNYINQLEAFEPYFSNQDLATYYYIKSVLAEGNHDLSKSFAFFKLFHNYSDSVFLEEKIWRTIEFEQDVELENRQNKITRLEQEHEIDEAKTQQQRITIILISTVSVVAIIILVLFVNYYYNRQRLEKRLRNREVSLASVSNLVRGQEEERLRIAKDLHDGVGNNLAMITAEILKPKGLDNPAYLATLIQQTSEEVRNITHDLMPVAIRKFGLKEALTDLVEKWKHTSSVLIDINFEGALKLDKNSALTIFRIIQELIKNSITHGQAEYIHLLINQNSKEMNMIYEDNGKGFDLNELKTKEGIGFENIINRVNYLDGTMDIKKSSKGLKFSFVFINLKDEGSNSR